MAYAFIKHGPHHAVGMVYGMRFRGKYGYCRALGANVCRCVIGTCWCAFSKSQGQGLERVLQPA